MNKPDQESISSEQDTSVSRSSTFGVGPSPFNAVKFDLGVLLSIGILLWLMVDRISEDNTVQLIILAVYGISSMLWLITRTHRILHRLSSAEQTNVVTDQDKIIDDPEHRYK